MTKKTVYARIKNFPSKSVKTCCTLVLKCDLKILSINFPAFLQIQNLFFTSYTVYGTKDKLSLYSVTSKVKILFAITTLKAVVIVKIFPFLDCIKSENIKF